LDNDVDDNDVDDVVGGLRGGEFRVLACADTGSEDPLWRAPLLNYVCQLYSNFYNLCYLPYTILNSLPYLTYYPTYLSLHYPTTNPCIAKRSKYKKLL
jgi:hypothetical protein